MGLLQMLVRLGLDASGYETGLKRAQSLTHSMGEEITSSLTHKILEFASVAAFEEGIRGAIEYGEKIANLSLRTGITTEQLQRLDLAAAHGGIALEQMVNGMEKLGIAQAKARGGDTEIRAALQRLGLSDAQINNLEKVYDNFLLISDGIKNTSEVTGQLDADLTKAMGKAARELLPAMRKGIREIGAELEPIDAEKIVSLAEASERVKTIWFEIRSLFADLFSFASKGLQELAIQEAAAAAFVRVLWETKSFAQAKRAADQLAIDAREAMAEKHEKDVSELTKRETGKRYESGEEINKDAKAKEKHELNEIVRIHERILEIRRRTALEGMTDAEKLKALEAERKSILEKAGTGFAVSAEDKLEAEKRSLRLAEIEEEKARILGKERLKEQKEKVSFGARSDSFISIGNIIGGDPNRPVVDKLEVLHVDLREVVTKLNGGSATASSTYPGS